jgi:hypothetical protein
MLLAPGRVSLRSGLMPKLFKPLTAEWLNKPYPELKGDYPQL